MICLAGIQLTMAIDKLSAFTFSVLMPDIRVTHTNYKPFGYGLVSTFRANVCTLQ